MKRSRFGRVFLAGVFLFFYASAYSRAGEVNGGAEQSSLQYKNMQSGGATCSAGIVASRTPTGASVDVTAVAVGKGADFRKWKVEEISLRVAGDKIRPDSSQKFFATKHSYFRAPAALLFAAIGTQYTQYATRASTGEVCPVTGQPKTMAVRKGAVADGIDKVGMAAGMGLLASQAKGEIDGQKREFNLDEALLAQACDSGADINIDCRNDAKHQQEVFGIPVRDLLISCCAAGGGEKEQPRVRDARLKFEDAEANYKDAGERLKEKEKSCAESEKELKKFQERYEQRKRYLDNMDKAESMTPEEKAEWIRFSDEALAYGRMLKAAEKELGPKVKELEGARKDLENARNGLDAARQNLARAKKECEAEKKAEKEELERKKREEEKKARQAERQRELEKWDKEQERIRAGKEKEAEDLRRKRAEEARIRAQEEADRETWEIYKLLLYDKYGPMVYPEEVPSRPNVVTDNIKKVLAKIGGWLDKIPGWDSIKAGLKAAWGFFAEDIAKAPIPADLPELAGRAGSALSNYYDPNTPEGLDMLMRKVEKIGDERGWPENKIDSMVRDVAEMRGRIERGEWRPPEDWK